MRIPLVGLVIEESMLVRRVDNLMGMSTAPLPLDSEFAVYILLIGPPASAKTMFLTSLMHQLKNSHFSDSANSTKAGMIDYFLNTSASSTWSLGLKRYFVKFKFAVSLVW